MSKHPSSRATRRAYARKHARYTARERMTWYEHEQERLANEVRLIERSRLIARRARLTDEYMPYDDE